MTIARSLHHGSVPRHTRGCCTTKAQDRSLQASVAPPCGKNSLASDGLCSTHSGMREGLELGNGVLQGNLPHLISDFRGSPVASLSLSCGATTNPHRLAFHKMRLTSMLPRPFAEKRKKGREGEGGRGGREGRKTASPTIKPDPNNFITKEMFFPRGSS